MMSISGCESAASFNAASTPFAFAMSSNMLIRFFPLLRRAPKISQIKSARLLRIELCRWRRRHLQESALGSLLLLLLDVVPAVLLDTAHIGQLHSAGVKVGDERVRRLLQCRRIVGVGQRRQDRGLEPR